MTQILRPFLLVLVLLFGLPVLEGCGNRRQTYSSQESIERPAKRLEDEKTIVDRAGEVVIVIVVVGGALALIALPIILLL